MSALPPGFIVADEPPIRPRAAAAPVGPAVVQHHYHYGRDHRPLFVALAIGLLVGLAAWVELRSGPRPPEPPIADGVAVGRQLGPAVTEALAKGFDADAEQLDGGKSVGEADARLKQVFEKERQKAFQEIGAPFLSKIVAAGEEPKDDAVRKSFADAHRALARGLRAK